MKMHTWKDIMRESMEKTDGMLTTSQLATMLSISESRIYHIISDIPHYKFGSSIRFDKREIADWIQSKRVYTKREIKAKAEKRCKK